MTKENKKRMVDKIIHSGGRIIEVLSDNDLNELEGVYACAHVASYLIAAIIKRNNLDTEHLEHSKKAICNFISGAIDNFIRCMSEVPKVNMNKEISEITKSVKWED